MMDKENMNKKGESGQILLITLLVLSFAAIVVLSLISRTTTTQKITTQVEESAKAFSAAEAGLELALQGNMGGGSTETDVVFNTSSGPLYISDQYILSEKTLPGELANVWLVGRAGNEDINEDPSADFAGNEIKVCWTEDTSKQAAIIATLLYKKDNKYKIGKIAWDNKSGRSQGFKYDTSSVNECPSGYIGQNLTFDDLVAGGFSQITDTLLAVRLRPLYFSTQFIVDTTPIALPPQGIVYTSTGRTSSGISRKVQVEKIFPAPGAIFDYVVYGQSGSFSQ